MAESMRLTRSREVEEFNTQQTAETNRVALVARLIGRWKEQFLKGRIGLTFLGMVSSYHCLACAQNAVPYAKIEDPESMALTLYCLVGFIVVFHIALWIMKSRAVSILAFLSSLLGLLIGTLVMMS